MQSSYKSRIPSTIDVPQVAALRPPIKLDRARASTHFRPPEAEHARTNGTAASAAGNSCCAQFVILHDALIVIMIPYQIRFLVCFIIVD